MSLGEKIKLLRKSKNLTQNELGKLLNVSFQAVSKWEKNVSQPDIETIKKICEIFEINVDNFLKDNFTLKPNKEVVHSKVEKSALYNEVNTSNEKALVLSRNQLIIIICAALAAILAVVGIILAITIPNSRRGSVYDSVNPSVVCVSTTAGNNLLFGSGFFISNTQVVTNYHVVAGIESGKVKLSDGTELNITGIAGYDRERDIAVLIVDTEPLKDSEEFKGGVKTVSLGNSDNIRVGDRVYAIGYPQSYFIGNNVSTLTEGIISKTSYMHEGYSYIQTTADITNGNSGGVLVNESGEVIGITTAQLSVTGEDYMNMSIPINSLKNLDKSHNYTLEEFVSYNAVYTIRFYVDNYVDEVRSVHYNETVESYTPTKTGYTFVRWNDELGTEFNFNTPINKNTNLYAEFTPNEYTITLFLDGGSLEEGTENSVKVTYNAPFTLPTPTKEGFEFVRWILNGSELPAVYNIANDSIATAVWREEPKTISYILNDGTNNAENPTSFRNDESLTITLKPASKDYYKFDGWYLDSSFNTQVTEINTFGEDDITLYAKFTPITYTIDYELNDGSVIHTFKRRYTIEDTFTLPNNLEKAHYDFLGWICLQDETREPKLNYTVQNRAGNLTFEAIFEPTKYKATFDLDGGTLVEGEELFETFTYFDNFELPKLEKEHYVHIGYTINGYYMPGNKPYTSLPSWGVDATFKAVYEKFNYEINYYDLSGNLFKTDYYTFDQFPVTLENFAPEDAFEVKDDKNYSSAELTTEISSITEIGNHSIYKNFYATAVVEYTINSYNKNVTVTGTDFKGTVYIPAEIGDFPVVSISFGGNTTIETLYVPNTVATYGYRCFKNSTTLKQVLMYESELVNTREGTIGEQAFYGCSNLEKLELPDNVTLIDENAFSLTSKLTMNIPSSLERIEDYAFSNSGFNPTENFPETLTYIGRGAFNNCPILENELFTIDNCVVINNILVLGRVNQEDGKTSVIPENVTRLTGGCYGGDYLSYDRLTKTIVIPDGVSSIPAYFVNYSYVETIEIGANVTSIIYNAFNSCPSIENVYIRGAHRSLSVSTSSDINYYYEANNYIESYKTYCKLDQGYAHWVGTNVLEFNGETYNYKQEEPTFPGNFWYYDEVTGKIKLWGQNA